MNYIQQDIIIHKVFIGSQNLESCYFCVFQNYPYFEGGGWDPGVVFESLFKVNIKIRNHFIGSYVFFLSPIHDWEELWAALHGTYHQVGHQCVCYHNHIAIFSLLT